MTRVLLPLSDAPEQSKSRSSSSPPFIAIGGLAIAVVGWIDVALLWLPFDVGDVEWEFATVGAHLSGMPLSTLGIILLVSAASQRGWGRTCTAVSVVAGLTVVMLLMMAGLYALTLPVAFGGTPEEVRPVLIRTVLKSGAFFAVYLALYAWLMIFAWRVGRDKR